MMTATLSSTRHDGAATPRTGNRSGEDKNPVVEQMIDAARSWLRRRAVLRGRVPVTMLSPDEHVALKAQMFAAVSQEVAHHPDLDREIAYLQALGKLAAAMATNATENAG